MKIAILLTLVIFLVFAKPICDQKHSMSGLFATLTKSILICALALQKCLNFFKKIFLQSFASRYVQAVVMTDA